MHWTSSLCEFESWRSPIGLTDEVAMVGREKAISCKLLPSSTKLLKCSHGMESKRMKQIADRPDKLANSKLGNFKVDNS